MKKKPIISENKHAPIQSREEIREAVMADGPRVMIAFSGGKDSIATWLWMRDKYDGIDIIPFYEYLVPGLEFVEESLAWYEKFFGGVRIRRIPNANFYRMLNQFIFQAPQNRMIIVNADLPTFHRDDARDALCDDLGGEILWTANGCRQTDNLARRAHFSRHGAINEKRKVFYPVWDMRIAELVTLIAHSGCRLPVDYQLFGRSFDGLDLRYLIPIKKHFPRDFERICEFFPMCDMAVWRHEYAQKYTPRKAA